MLLYTSHTVGKCYCANSVQDMVANVFLTDLRGVRWAASPPILTRRPAGSWSAPRWTLYSYWWSGRQTRRIERFFLRVRVPNSGTQLSSSNILKQQQRNTNSTFLRDQVVSSNFHCPDFKVNEPDCELLNDTRYMLLTTVYFKEILFLMPKFA